MAISEIKKDVDILETIIEKFPKDSFIKEIRTELLCIDSRWNTMVCETSIIIRSKEIPDLNGNCKTKEKIKILIKEKEDVDSIRRVNNPISELEV